MLQLPEGSIVKRQLEKKTWHLKSSLHEHGASSATRVVLERLPCTNSWVYSYMKYIYIYKCIQFIFVHHEISWWMIAQRKRLNIDMYSFQYPTIAIHIYIYMNSAKLDQGKECSQCSLTNDGNLSATWNHQPMPWKHKCTLMFFTKYIKCNKKCMNTLMFTLINLNG